MPRKTNADLFRIVKNDLPNMMTVSDIPEYRYFPTILTSFNRASGIGGFPLQKVSLLHGPNQVGKTGFALAIANSSKKYNIVPSVYDSEFAAENRWYNSIAGESFYESVGSLDELYESMNKKWKKVEDIKEKQKIEGGSIFIIDTLTKLMPADVIKKIEKDGIDKMYPIQALWVSVWMKEIIPKLYRTNSAALIVLQERQNVGASMFEKKYKVTLGNAIQYDNCLRIRVSSSKKIKENKKLVGMECLYTVENNKLDGTTLETGVFYTSNGRGECPKGLDLVREALQECRHRGILKARGKHTSINVGKMALNVEGSLEATRKLLRQDTKMFNKLVSELNRTAADFHSEDFDV